MHSVSTPLYSLPSLSLSLSLCSDIEKIQSGIGDKVAVFLSYFSTFVTGYVIAFTRSWKMALVVMTMLPLLATVGAIMSRVSESYLPNPPHPQTYLLIYPLPHQWCPQSTNTLLLYKPTNYHITL